MKRTTVSTRLGDLVRLLGSFEEIHGRLGVLLESKIDAMRRADVEAMGELEHRERTIVEQLKERDGLRRQLMDAIGVELGLPAKAGRTLNLTQLGLRIPEPERAALIEAGDSLRNTVMRIRQMERVASMVSREVSNHLQWVLSAVRPRDEHPNVYSNDGALVRSGGPAMVELVG